MNPKYYLLAVAAALSLGACSRDKTDSGPENSVYKISFTVASDSETRTTLDEGDVLRWVVSDKVGVYTVGDNVNLNASTVADVDQSPVVFSGVMEESVTPGDRFYAYYPYDAEQSSNPEAVTLSIPAEQTQTVAGVYNGQSNPLVALPMPIVWEQNSHAGRICNVRFRQLGAIVEMQLYSTDEALREEMIRSVTFESKDKPLAGDFQFDLTTVAVTGEQPIEGYESTKVTTALDEPAAIPATKDEAARVYLTIAPGTYTGRIVVETDVAQYTFPLAEEMTFERAVIKGLPADLAEASQFIDFADPKVKEICVANWDKNGDGELSYAEAAEVTELGEVFSYNRTITSFDELQYFTGLQSIGTDAFYGCTTLTSINIPNGVTTIGNEAFHNCLQLKSIELPDGVTTIGERAFEYCGLTSINIPNEVTEIGIYAFSFCEKLTSINIPEGVTEIGEGVFSNCRNLTNIDIPERVTAIGTFAFFDCSSLTTVNIPDGVTEIGMAAFGECGNLERVYCKPTDPPTLGGYIFNEALPSLKIYVPAASVGDYKTAERWSEYASQIFADINEDDPIDFEDQNVEAICLREWDANGDGALSYAEAAAVTDLGDVFYNRQNIATFNELQYFTGLQSIGESAFFYCSRLTSVNIPESVTEIGQFAFYNCSSLATVNFPKGVTTIGKGAFQSCSSLSSIELPDGVTTIGNSAFHSCSNLTSIHIPQTVSSIGNWAFRSCSSLSAFSGDYASEDQRCLIQDGTLLAFAPAGQTEYTIPEGVTAIGYAAFYSYGSLTSIVIPSGVGTIGEYAFHSCSGLTSVYCKSADPPTLDGVVVFESTPESMKIYVPAASVEAYKAADGWRDYESKIVVDLNDPISFEDQKVKQLCLKNWDENKDGELSRKEAAKVTELKNVFSDNRTITSFDEFQYFTGLKTIEENGFSGCESLTSITIPEGVTTIGNYAFEMCISLTSIELPNGVTAIGYNAFAACSKLASINIPERVTEIQLRTFYGCSSLTSIELPNGVTTIGESAFYSCSSLASIELPNGVTTIGDSAFSNCISLTSINIPDGVTVIEVNTFYGCSSLTSIELPNGLKTIGNNAFRDCSSLTSITIPESVTEIKSFAFYDCSKLTSVYCKPTDPPTLTSCEFPMNSSLKIYVPAGSVEAYKTAPSWVSYITKIFADPNDPISFVDQKAKQLCVKKWDTNKDGELSYKEAAEVTELGTVFNWNTTITSFNELQYFTRLRSIEENAFSGCTSLTSIHIPEGVTKIGKNAFNNCNQLTSIELPNGVTAIGESAFEFCSNLTSINIPNEVTEIGKNAFSLCENLTSINIPEGVAEIREGVFSNCSSLTNIDIPERVTAIGTLAFFNCRSLTGITIPEGVTAIENGVFSNCRGLTSITIPEGVTTIGKTAFMDCSSLTSITIPEGVRTIGATAFKNCSSLTSITIPEGVTTIENGVFSNCRGLTSVYCKPTTPPTLDSDIFYGASPSLTIYVPAALVDTYKKAEYWSTYSSQIFADNS